MKKRSIYITEPDMNRLQGLLESGSKFGHRDKKHLIELEDELNRARVVPAKKIPEDVITMNSRVRLKDLDSGEEMVYSLVFAGCFRYNADDTGRLSLKKTASRRDGEARFFIHRRVSPWSGPVTAPVIGNQKDTPFIFPKPQGYYHDSRCVN